MKLYLIVADDGASWSSADEQDVWDATNLWADGNYEIFCIEASYLGTQVDVVVQRLIRAEEGTAHRERALVWEEVKTAEELKTDGSNE